MINALRVYKNYTFAKKIYAYKNHSRGKDTKGPKVYR